MPPNIFLISLDSLRADYVFSPEKSSITPNLDQLISNGTYFTNAFSTADNTFVSWISLLTSLFPINSKINPYKFDSDIKSFVEIFKNNDYKTFCFFPDISFFKIISEKFDDSVLYDYTIRDDFLKLGGGLLNQIIKKIKSQKKSESWFNCIHLMDYKAPFEVPDEFNHEKFGKNKYEKMLSYLDTQLGKIFENIDFENSIIVFSSDHGDYIPIKDQDIRSIPTIQNIMKKGKNHFPFLEPAGVKAFELIRESTAKIRKQKKKRVLNNLEMRSFMDRNRDVLYDEVIHVPLLFFGKNIPSMKIPKLARHVDILPTVCSLCNLSYSKTDYDGANLSPMFGGNKMEELVAYIESGPSNKDLDGKVIGIRTSRYKYFRSRTNPSDNTHLYDKLNDPSEERNIAKDLPETVNSMEKHLLKLQNDTDTDELSDSERDMIQEELKKLGYI